MLFVEIVHREAELLDGERCQVIQIAEFQKFR